MYYLKISSQFVSFASNPSATSNINLPHRSLVMTNLDKNNSKSFSDVMQLFTDTPILMSPVTSENIYDSHEIPLDDPHA